MQPRLTDSRLANLVANAICAAFDTLHADFKAITRRASVRFEQQDWAGMQADAAERLDLYKKVVDRIVDDIRRLLDERVAEKLVWASLKAVYSGLITNRDDWEQAETFFNSVTRRIFATVGVDPQIEFVDTDFETPPTQAVTPLYRTYQPISSLSGFVTTMLADYQFRVPYEDSQRDAKLVAGRILAHMETLEAPPVIQRAEMVKAIFYRGQGAYLVGRLVCGALTVPLVLALLHGPRGLVVDAVLLTEDDVSILFSFTRSYFRVVIDRPYDLVQFLKSIMPQKPAAEIYISIGYNKHGKTELYRDLLHHLLASNDTFEIAPGEQGMVMVVFTLPDYNLVFKIIKDRFSYPKNTTRREVMAKYHLVFKHDRAGRLIDAQEFEHLKFERSRFSAELLNELQRAAAQTVIIGDTAVVIKHAYVERRVIPLNVYIARAEPAAARAAVIDFGQAIKDLAATNIFPGDMLLKNFGVTRHGRVVFYDYDELGLLTDCNFRAIPQATAYEDELFAEPWFTIGENDVFVEQFRHFFSLPGPLHAVFLAHHGYLLRVKFWQQIQARLRAGEIIGICPYGEDRRLATLRLAGQPEAT